MSRLVQAMNTVVRSSPQKLNVVAGSIRRKHVQDAIHILNFSQKRVADVVLKTLNSAIANAEHNHGLDVDRLYVKEAFVGKSLVMKRFRARARGRGARIIKPVSRITVILAEEEI
jgi:large subunit ribosomal protein L22